VDESDADRIPPSLKTAVRKARVDMAERSDVVNDLRRAEIARLDILHEAFKPILAQVPAHVDLFDCGIVPGERPRLFVDMIAWVEMGHDRRTYRFAQETRNGRVTLAENDRVEPVVEAMTDYIARRLVEREAVFASEITGYTPPAAAAPRRQAASVGAPGAAPVAANAAPAAEAAPPAKGKSRWRQRLESALLFTIELLGAIVLFILVIGALYFAWRFSEAWWIARFAQVN
jgi:hypothetical protein